MKTASNCRIGAEEEAIAANMAAMLLVWELDRGGETRRQASAISRKTSPQRRRATARQYARKYVPRGGIYHALVTELLLRMATAASTARADGSRTLASIQMAQRIALTGSAAFAYFPEGARVSDRERRTRAAHWARLREASELIHRRGTSRCMNGSCDRRVAAATEERPRPDYCGDCQEAAKVQTAHNRRIKAIEALWSSALPALRHLLDDDDAPDAPEVADAG